MVSPWEAGDSGLDRQVNQRPGVGDAVLAAHQSLATLEMHAAVVETHLRRCCTRKGGEARVTGAACHTPMSRLLRSFGGGLGLKRQLMFGFVLISLPLSRLRSRKTHEAFPEPLPLSFPLTTRTHAHIILGKQPHLFWAPTCEQLEKDQALDPRGVVPHALTPTVQLSPMQFHVPPKESRTAVAVRAASACPTATAWIISSRLRFGEAHAPIARGAPRTALKYVLVCTVFPSMGSMLAALLDEL